MEHANRDRARGFTRRTFLKGTAAGAAGVAASSFVAPAFLRHTASAQGTTTVRLTGFTSSPAEPQLLNEVLADFEKANPSVKVSYEPIPSDYVTKLLTDIAAGTVADVFYVQGEYATDFEDKGTLLALDDYMAKSGVKASDFYPSLIKAYQWKGKTYGLPKDFSTLGQEYLTTTFQKAEITAAPTTWDELTAAGQKMKTATGKPQIVLSADFERYIAFLYEAGGSVATPDFTKITLNSPEAQKALDFFYGMITDGIAVPYTDVGAGWPGDALIKELGSLVFEGNWIFPAIQQANPKLPYKIAAMPKGPAGPGTPAFTVSYSIYAKTKVPDAAWTLVNWLTGPTGMADWTDKGLAVPTRPALVPAWLDKYPERKVFVEAADYATAAVFPPGGQKFINDANAILQSLFAKQIDTKQALQQMVDKAKADFNLPTA